VIINRLSIRAKGIRKQHVCDQNTNLFYSNHLLGRGQTGLTPILPSQSGELPPQIVRRLEKP
jgi:hypothetical protein